MPYTKKENRKYSRHDYPLTIEYVLDPQRGGTLHKGVTINFSSAGLGAYVLDHLPIGQKIIIKTELPFDYQTAEVCWIRERNSSFYCAGLKFI